MAGNLSSKRIAFSLASISGIIYIICAILVVISQEWTVKVFGYLFHGIDITKIATAPTLSGTLIGFVEIIILGLIVGWLYAKIYNKFR